MFGLNKSFSSFVLLIIVAGFVLGTLFSAYSVTAAVYVKGYTTKNGTYVAPYYRSNPDGNPYNNYSYPGNTNPYTGVTATGNPDTYLNNYSGYSSGSTASYSSYTPPSSSYTSTYGGYYLYGILFCNTGYYESGTSCVNAPANATAYGSTNFYCNYGYTKSGSSCVSNSSSYTNYSYSNTSAAAASATCPSNSHQTIYGCILNVTNPTCSEHGDKAYYDTSTSKCNCSPGYFLNETTNKCDTPNNACQALNGPNSYGIGSKCYCNDGYTYSITLKSCVAARETRSIKGYLKNMADFTTDTCSALGLASATDVNDCNFYRLNKSKYDWKAI